MSALDQLAAQCGIQASSKDVHGREHAISPELKRRLLAAMRFQVEDDGAAQRRIDDLEQREWQRALPPVLVLHRRSDDPAMTLPVVVSEGQLTCAWTLALEQGGMLRGETAVAGLPLLATKQIGTARFERHLLTLRGDIPFGYHRLRVDGSDAMATLIVTPGQCWLPPEADQRRLWGLAVNLYLLRSEHNWGIGDFSDLRDVLQLLRREGADAVGVNPLHAMFPDHPEDASPYSPSDRLLLNVLNIDVEAVPEFARSTEVQRLLADPEFRRRLQRARDAEMVDYSTVTELKLTVLRLLFAQFEQEADPARLAALDAFHNERRDLLDRACVFQAMRDFFGRQEPSLIDCALWPAGLQAHNGPGVQPWAREHRVLVRFQLWLQWIADDQLKLAAEAAQGMPIGLYRDLAVGAHPTGAEVWCHPDALVASAHVGAPPDLLNLAGQNWGLPPMHPLAAREQAYASFTELVRANMRYAGALRIDHAMALLRLYWIPEGNHAGDGAYVHYPLDDLLGILALESHRAQCMVIGEALGTVPEGFLERLNEARVLAYLVVNFEVKKGHFLPPAEYPYLGLSVASNHDLATQNGWWTATDLNLREGLGLFPDGSHKARAERALDRAGFVRALQQEQLLPAGVRETEELDLVTYADAATRFLGRTNCLLSLVQIEDVFGLLDQVNLPGTNSEHPNWRRKLPVTVQQLTGNPAAAAQLEHTARMLREERETAAQRDRRLQ